jgi:hypothetical protein
MSVLHAHAWAHLVNQNGNVLGCDFKLYIALQLFMAEN